MRKTSLTLLVCFFTSFCSYTQLSVSADLRGGMSYFGKRIQRSDGTWSSQGQDLQKETGIVALNAEVGFTFAWKKLFAYVGINRVTKGLVIRDSSSSRPGAPLEPFDQRLGYQFWQIPIALGYRLDCGKWKISPAFGASYNHFRAYRLVFVEGDERTAILSSRSENPQNEPFHDHWALFIQAFASRPIAGPLSLVGGMRASMGIQDMEPLTDFKYYPIGVEIQAGLQVNW